MLSGDMVLRIQKIPSTTFAKECEVVFKLMQTIPIKIAVETGTGLGRMTVAMALAIKETGGKVFTVDSYSGGTRYGNELKVSWNRDKAKANIHFAGADNVLYIDDTSLNYFDMLPDESVDFIYLDGDHTYTYVTQEIALAYRKLRKGGILAGHDFSTAYPEGLLVMKAVMEHFVVGNDTSAIKIQERIWSVVKK